MLNSNGISSIADECNELIGGIELPMKSIEQVGSPTINASCGCTQQSFCGGCSPHG